MGIPIVLYVQWVRTRNGRMHFHWIPLMYVAFIALCGLTHLMGYLTWYYSFYILEMNVKGLTALVSVITLFLSAWVSWRFQDVENPIKVKQREAVQRDVERALVRRYLALEQTLRVRYGLEPEDYIKDEDLSDA